MVKVKPQPGPNTTSNNPANPLSHIVHPPSPPDATSSSSVDLSKVRAYAACRNCRTKKIKCLPGTSPLATLDSHGNPSGPGPCQQCSTGGLECTYPPTRDRAAYSRQYVQNLEARVQALEMVQNRLLPMLDAFEQSSGTSSSNSRTLTLPLPTRAGPDEEQRSDEVDGGAAAGGSGRERTNSPAADPESELDDGGGQMTQDERGNYRWIGSSNTLSILDSFNHNRSPHEPTPPLTSHDGGNNPYFAAVAGSGVVKALPGVDEVSYPSPERAGEMIDAFFREVHPILPVVEEKSFREGYKALMDRRARGQPELPGGFITVVFAIFALGDRVIMASRAWQREKTKLREGKATGETVLPGEAEAGVIWYERAQILHYTTMKDVNLHQVQCLTLMAAFQASVNAMPMSWLLAGQAIRVAQDLGLHRSTARLKLSFAEKQIRARCWWALYGLERLMSVTLGRPLGVDDLDIDVALPVAIDDSALSNTAKTQCDSPDAGEESPSSTISGFIALTKLCKIAGRVAQLLYRPSHRSVSDPSWSAQQQNTINKLDKLLKDWLDNDVPAKYKDQSSAARSVQLVSAVLSNAYFAVLLTLHRNFLPSNPDYPRPRPPSNSQSLSHLVEAARSVIHVAAQQRVLLPPSHHLAATCHNLWSSAIILLLCEVQARDQIVVDAVGSSVESCRQTLQALEPAWPGSRKLKELLNDVETKMKEVAVNGIQNIPTRSKKRKSTVSDTPPTSSKKGISSTHVQAHGMALPPSSATASPRQGSWNPTLQMTPGSAHPRSYETSDTRTRREDENPFNTHSYPSSHSSTNITPPSQTTAMFANTNTNANANTNASNNGNNGATGGFDTSQLFDIGGVTFDGLEMLQGFDFTTDATSFWNSFISPTAAGTFTISDQNTPNSNMGGGPSPTGWTIPQNVQNQMQSAPSSSGKSDGNFAQQSQQQFQQPHQQQQQPQQPQQVNVSVSGLNVNNALSGATTDFWSQVAPGGYDWAADPSVPFNI